jgi:7,8-dihydropterin-6-yl-methyl-4-(beta-D-ribofuranosyl)aminobenzene 5'-phosphate synthase
MLLGADLVLVTGEVERVTDFEKGFPLGRKFEEGKIKPDTEVTDEQAIVLNVEGKGLVILTGCGHQGIINTITYAQKLTQETRVYFVMGGFHLTGPLFEPLIDRTVAGMKKFSPQMIVPTHCTGWKAMSTFAKEMPNEFVLNSVGTKYVL